MPGLLVAGRLLVPQPDHLAKNEVPACLGHHLGNADDPAQFSPRRVVVRQGADKIETSVTGQVDQPGRKSHRDRSRDTGVVGHQVTDADQGCELPRPQDGPAGRRPKTDLVGPLVGPCGNPLHPSPVADPETVSQRMGHDSASPHLANLDTVRVEDSRCVDCRESLVEVDKGIQRHVRDRKLRGDGQGNAVACRQFTRWLGPCHAIQQVHSPDGHHRRQQHEAHRPGKPSRHGSISLPIVRAHSDHAYDAPTTDAVVNTPCLPVARQKRGGAVVWHPADGTPGPGWRDATRDRS